MKRYFALCLLVSAATLLAGCYNSGSSAPAPVNVQVVAGDTSATLTWDLTPGVEYWIFKAAAANLTPQDCLPLPKCGITMKAVSPSVVSGLVNGTLYSFTINGRVDGGKGGAGSPSVQATPRLAGATWDLGATLSSGNLRGVTYGSVFVAAGDNSALFSSTDGINWTTLTSPVAATNLNAASYYGGTYLVVGAGGVIWRSTDAVTWTPPTSGTTNALYAVTVTGTGGFVATGASGTILTSVNGIIWTTVPPVTTNSLYGITYANNKYVAVGTAGTILTSADAATWDVPTSNTSSTLNTLKSIAYAPPVIGTTGSGTFVAVGSSGSMVISSDKGLTWAPTTSPFSTSTIINAITYGRQFVAVAEDGSIFTSTDGLTWAATTTTPANTSPIYAVTRGLYDYTAVGAGGLNLHAK